MRLFGTIERIGETRVSIHASVKDATLRSASTLNSGGFNPRICKRCDFFRGVLPRLEDVSIHASVKDATPLLHLYPVGLCFNPRICKRCDSMFVKNFIDDTFKL